MFMFSISVLRVVVKVEVKILPKTHCIFNGFCDIMNKNKGRWEDMVCGF